MGGRKRADGWGREAQAPAPSRRRWEGGSGLTGGPHPPAGIKPGVPPPSLLPPASFPRRDHRTCPFLELSPGSGSSWRLSREVPAARARRRGLAEEQEPVPQDRDFQWTLWLMGNQNTKEEAESEQQKIYRYLEKSPRINKMELDYFAVPEELLIQPVHIVTMLHTVVDYYNTMMPIRQKYLFKKLHGCWCKEMDQMLKRLTKYVELADEKIEAIREAGGDCPPRPKVSDALPDLCK